MKKILAVFLSLILLLSLMTGCGGDKGTTGTGEAKDTITIVINAEPETLDPASANADPISIVLNFVCENLFELDANGQIYTELLESYEFTDDTTLKGGADVFLDSLGNQSKRSPVLHRAQIP